MHKLVFTREELAEQVLGIKVSTLVKREKAYIGKLGCQKRGRGKSCTYHFSSPVLIQPKIKFERIFGFKSSRPKDMDKYLVFLSENSYGFCMSDYEIARQLKMHRPNVTTVRRELEVNGFLTPIQDEERQSFKIPIFTNTVEKATVSEWRYYWYKYMENVRYGKKHGFILGPKGENLKVNKYNLHLATSIEVGYRVFFKYKRETFFFELLMALDEYCNYQLYTENPLAA